MSEKEAEKLMYAIGDVSEEMLKEAEDYSENIKKMSFRQKRLKKYAKTPMPAQTRRISLQKNGQIREESLIKKQKMIL